MQNFKQEPYLSVTDGPILVICPTSGKPVDVRTFLAYFQKEANCDPVFGRMKISTIIEFINTNIGLKNPDINKMRKCLVILHSLQAMFDEMVEQAEPADFQ